ncbi:MAG TPA: SDR family oxidoreductase [Tepidisphaeraceae bacterium]|jgi:short-subunit dehydrogenase|nr:SDR family oxidoreductase [Tepidisphaeraceae bacterium]
MTPILKPLAQQTMVITGASSGIGLSTARAAAKAGAKLVLAARSDDALQQLVEEINGSGGTATHVAVDVADEGELRTVAQVAIERFGGFDTWVNNAGVSIYGRLDQVPMDEFRRLFDTNFWGVVNGSLVAMEHLRNRGGGGAIINIGSTLSDRAIPLQGMYCASKHAVKGFTDALRMEIEEAGAPISVTLIKPAAIDTPYTRNAKNYLSEAPTNPPPVYAPGVVAETILYAATHPVRDLFAGAGGKMISAMGSWAPRLTDRFMEKAMFKQQHSGRPPRDRSQHALDRPSNDLTERGEYDGHVAKMSFYNKAEMHPFLSGALMAGAGLAIAALVSGETKRPMRKRHARMW